LISNIYESDVRKFFSIRCHNELFIYIERGNKIRKENREEVKSGIINIKEKEVK
jgi:hypothetical protein